MSYLGIDAEGAERRGMRKNDEEQVNTYVEENALCSVTSEFYIIGVPTRIYQCINIFSVASSYSCRI